jgi:hypothetical protein
MTNQLPIVFARGDWFAYTPPHIVNGQIRFAPVRYHRTLGIDEVVDSMWFTEMQKDEAHFGAAYCVQYQGESSRGIADFLAAAELKWSDLLQTLRTELAEED